MSTTQLIGDVLIDFRGIIKVHDDGSVIGLHFTDPYKPTCIISGEAAAKIRAWMREYSRDNPEGFSSIMGKYTSHQPSPELVQALRTLARTIESPSEILAWLKPQVQSKDMFVDYLLYTFGDQSTLWTIATRWWDGHYPGSKADAHLRYALQETEPVWNTPS